MVIKYQNACLSILLDSALEVVKILSANTFRRMKICSEKNKKMLLIKY